MSAVIFRGKISKRMIDAAVEALAKGELIIYPTDTIYGIGCDMANPKALTKLNNLKKRPSKKPFSFICDGLSEISQYAKLSNSAHRVLRQVLPGPYTFVLPVNNSVSRKMVNTEHAIGVRIPNHPVPLEIVKRFGRPITTTSVNVATEEPISSIEELTPEFRNAVAVIIDQGELENVPSTIVDFTGQAPVILREGKGIEELRPYINFTIEQ